MRESLPETKRKRIIDHRNYCELERERNRKEKIRVLSRPELEEIVSSRTRPFPSDVITITSTPR